MTTAALVCRHCRRELREREGSSGRYRYEDLDTPDTAIFGSGSECPNNDRGHEPLAEPVNYLVTNGNACWLEGDVIMCAPLDTLSRPQWVDTGAADPRAFHDNDDYARLAQALEIAAGIDVG